MINIEGAPHNPFEPIRDGLRLGVPPGALERLADLAKIPAHYRPTFANSLIELFAKAHRWHRLANRSVEMDAATKKLVRIAKNARKLKRDIDRLSEKDRTTLGLYALRLERFGEAGSHEMVRNQIEELLHSGSQHAGQKVKSLAFAIDQLGSAAATQTWPKRETSFSVPWKGDSGCKIPYLDTFDRFVTELREVVRACNGAVRFEQDALSGAVGDDLRAFLKVSSAFLPNEFIPKEVFHTNANRSHTNGSLDKLKSFWRKRVRVGRL